MKTLAITAALLTTTVIAVNAQSPANVEKANRFRAPQAQTEVVLATQTQKTNDEQISSVVVVPTGYDNAAQLEELGTDYGWAHGDNAAQLQELGSRYAISWSDNAAQLEEFGTDYGWAHGDNAAQLENLGTDYGWAHGD